MKSSHTLPTKRTPINPGILKRLRAVTRKRQHVAAAGEIEGDDGGARIARALMIIFLFHVIAIALIMIHQKFLEGRPAVAEKSSPNEAVVEQADEHLVELPKVSATDQAHAVRAGDNYARIAEKFHVNEDDLRLINGHADIKPGLILKIPPKRIVAGDPPEVAALRSEPVSLTANKSLLDEGLVEVNVADAPRAQVVESTVKEVKIGEDEPLPSAKIHVIKSGESVYGLAKRYGVSQQALMKANGIKDPRKIRLGSKLVIPN